MSIVYFLLASELCRCQIRQTMRSHLCVLILVLSASFAMAQTGIPSGIQRLHDEDVAATLAFDPQRLANLFSDDAVLLEPGSPPRIGRAAILAEDVKEKREHPQQKIVEYKPEIHDLRVNGDWAVEWTTFSAAFQEKPGARLRRFHARALRVLRKEPDGSWKFTHVAWNMAE
jgi:uncharacterized protein (TIGR02246 family)